MVQCCSNMNQCCSRTSKCCPTESSNEAQNQDKSLGQIVAFSRTDETVTNPLMSNMNVTQTSNQAQNQDESNGQGAYDTVTTPLMT